MSLLSPFLPSARALSLGGALLAAQPLLAQTTNNRGQLDAQRQGQYAYTPFTAMGAPVVLPMNGKLEQADWLTGMDVSLGGILFPHLHLDSAIGSASMPQGNLQVGHHDPSQNGFTWQNIEFGLSGRFNEYFEAFGTYAANVSPDGEFAGIYEEWFAKAQNLPGGFELRGGRIYNRFGIQNTYHPHGFDWADQYLVNARLLGEDSMTILGGDITWKLPVSWTSQFDVAVGVAPEGHEEHTHGEHEGEEPEFDAEGAAFDDVMTVANWTNIYNYNDFHQYRAGLSGAWGDNKHGRSTSIYGVHLEYQWRENGFEAGGHYFRWRTEAMWRQWGAIGGLELDGHEEHGHEAHAEEEHHDEVAEHHEEEEHGHEAEHEDEAEHDGAARRASLRDFGFYTSVLYGLPCNLEFGLRAEYVTGDTRAGLDDRFRLSPGITYYLNDARTVKLRAQYNYDNSSDFGTEHSVWGQISFAWGGPEVR